MDRRRAGTPSVRIPRQKVGQTLEVLGVGATSTARHALYNLDVLALLILALEAKVDPALVAAVGSLGWIDTLSRPSGYGPVPHDEVAMRGYGAEVNLALAKALVAQQERIASLEGRINKLEDKK